MVDVAFNYNDQEDFFEDDSEEFDSDDLIQPIHSSQKMARLRSDSISSGQTNSPTLHGKRAPNIKMQS